MLENNAEVDIDTVLGCDGGGEAPIKLELYEDVMEKLELYEGVTETPIPSPRIEDCSEAVLRTMLDWETAGLL